MKPHCLIDLSLLLILALNSKGQEWGINVTRSINATPGSDVIVPCTFTFPEGTQIEKVHWKKLKVKSSIDTNDNDQHAFITHSDPAFVLEKYRNKTKLIGNVAQGNCSLMILSIVEDVQDIYVRVITNKIKEKFSFYNKTVSIYVNGKGFVTATNSEDRDAQFTTEATNEPPSAATSTTVHVATFVPVSALVIIIIVSGIICYIKCKRSQTFTREESGYYANFSRASSNQAKSETLCKIHEDVKLPEPTVIDEPVYVNTEVTAAAPMAQSLDHKESIYANVDYSK